MEFSLSLPKSKAKFNVNSYYSDSKALLKNKGSQKISWKCFYPRSATVSTRTTTQLLPVKKDTYKVLCSKKQEIPVLEARSIEDIYNALAERLLPTLEVLMASDNMISKYIIGMAGPPGAGKTTVASEVVSRLNKLWSQSNIESNDDVATVLPMDGFHLYRSQLDAMENPEEAHARRGAPWTFNPELLLKCLQAIRNKGSVQAPSFDHGVGDPVENDVFVSLKHRVVIVEGNYLFLEDGVWKAVSSVFDEKWFIDIDVNTAMERVRKRHISTGKDPNTAKWRVEYNDCPNAELIMNSKKNADLIIRARACTHQNQEFHSVCFVSTQHDGTNMYMTKNQAKVCV